MILLSATAALGGFALLGLKGQTPAPPGSPLPKAEAPLGRKCVVSVDPQISRASLSASDNEVAGFKADGTARGELIRFSDDWCVLKDGPSETWIPTPKILILRVME